jgi:hypothetical protein
MHYPVVPKKSVGSRDLMEQLAPRENAKAAMNAEYSVFVGSLTMEMDR